MGGVPALDFKGFQRMLIFPAKQVGPQLVPSSWGVEKFSIKVLFAFGLGIRRSSDGASDWGSHLSTLLMESAGKLICTKCFVTK